MEDKSCRWVEVKSTEAKQAKTQQIETEQEGIKIILEFPKASDRYEKDAESEALDGYETAVTHEEIVKQEIRTLLVDMLREHFRKSTLKKSTEDTPKGADTP